MAGAWTQRSRQDYWQHLFPWAAVWRLCGDKRFPSVAHRFLLEDGQGETGMQRRAEFETVDAWRRHVANSRTSSVHAAVSPADAMVLDYDIRDDNTRPPPACITRAQHGPKELCPECWASHARSAIAHVDRHLREALGMPPEAMLRVFSGGNGVHLWFNLKRVPVEVREALGGRDSPVRRLLMRDWIGHAPRLQRLYGTTAALPRFDAAITTEVGDATHEPHLCRLPFSLHDRTRLVALPLAADESLPPHLARPGASEDEIVVDFYRRVRLFEDWLGTGTVS